MIEQNRSQKLTMPLRACCFRIPFLLPVLMMAGFGLIPAGRVTAQTFTTLHSFNYSDGVSPYAELVLTNNTLYGTAPGGGSSGNGTVFAINTDGTGFTVLHSFTAMPPSPAPLTNSDGAYPVAGLVLAGNTLYGTTFIGGSSGVGTVFKVNTDGTGFTNLYNFTALIYYTNFLGILFSTNSDGDGPQASLILSGNTLYGTASRGGSSGNGTVFAINTDGTGFTLIHAFTGSPSFFPYTHNDGANPSAGLTLSGHTLYGTASAGGTYNSGTVFAVNADGTGSTTLHNFMAPSGSSGFHGFRTNSDGALPTAGLILWGNTLYGTADEGGSSGHGTVFAINTNGTDFRVLYSFTATPPYGGLILSGNTLYGAASGDSEISWDNGTVFAVNTDGLGFTALHRFTALTASSTNSSSVYTNGDGAYPVAGLILAGNTLYGTTIAGGSSGYGTVFSLSLPPPQLTLIRFDANLILTWPTNATGFTLQSAASLGSSAIWTTNSPTPVVVNGQNTVTNPISGTQQFFRLSK